MDLSLVLACYNEGPLLGQSLEEIVAVLDATRLSYELVLVDDASTDGTDRRLKDIVRSFGGRVAVQHLTHARNTGRGRAVCDGIRAARGDIVGYLDVDLEIAAHHILPCVLAIQRGADVAVGKRIYKFRWRSLDRYLMSKGYAWLVRASLPLDGITDTESGCKFFRRNRVLPLVEQSREPGWFWDTEIMVLALRAGLRIAEVPCLFLRRFDWRSSVRPVRDTFHYLVTLSRFRRRVARMGAPARDGNQGDS
jgi:hypothetical protein